MDRLYEICDELASGDEFTSIGAIVDRFYGYHVVKLENVKESSTLRQQLKRYKHIIEYKNGQDLRGGFKYKSGHEYFFTKKEEENAINNLEGDKKRLYLTGGLQILFEGKTSSEHLIELECVPDLKNKELVKELIKYLGIRVISFKYHPGFQNEEMKVTIHPHLLKEYNSRWFLFGYVQQQDDRWEVVNVALDRIIYKPNFNSIIPHIDIQFKPAPKNFYCNYFKDIVGVTRMTKEETEHIIIRTIDFKVHQLLRTKKIHSSQVETMRFNIEEGIGEFTIDVIPNIELQTRILSYGPGLQIISKGPFQQKIVEAVKQMAKVYDES